MPIDERLVGSIPARFTSLRHLNTAEGPGTTRTTYRAVVRVVDSVGGQLADGCPPNTIIARITDLDANDDCLFIQASQRTFLPANDSANIRVGEDVTVMLAEDGGCYGHWFPTTPTGKPSQAIDLQPPSGFVCNSDDGAVLEPDVVPLARRVGDYVIEGRNNSCIILGHDRINSKASGYKFSAGSIHMVAGRHCTDINNLDDDSTVVVSMQTDVDDNLGVEVLTDCDDEGVYAAKTVAGKSDHVRLVGRKSIKLQVLAGEDGKQGSATLLIGSSGSITADNEIGRVQIVSSSKTIDIIHKVSKIIFTIDAEGIVTLKGAKELRLGEGADDPLVTWNEFKKAFDGHTHGHWMGPTIKPVTPLGTDTSTGTTSTKIYVKR